MNGRAVVIRGDARALPLPDASVDLIVTSPPYYALRSYTDGGQHYDEQIGSEPTPAEYIGRIGITVDRSMDYGAIVARWRTTDPGQRAKAMRVPKPPPVPTGQGDLFEALP